MGSNLVGKRLEMNSNPDSAASAPARFAGQAGPSI